MRPIQIKTATEDDIPRILQMITALAEYERMSERVTITEAQLREALFGERPLVQALMALVEHKAVGYALFFRSFSTFSGNPGIYLEDIFVESSWRGCGIGRKLLANVAAMAVGGGCDIMTWSVLDWNESAINFYRAAGAAPLKNWLGYGVAGETLNQLAREAL